MVEKRDHLLVIRSIPLLKVRANDTAKVKVMMGRWHPWSSDIMGSFSSVPDPIPVPGSGCCWSLAPLFGLRRSNWIARVRADAGGENEKVMRVGDVE